MANKRRNALLEQYGEAAMALLMDEYAEADGQRLLRQFAEAEQTGEAPEVPGSLDEKCRKLMDNAFRKEARKRKALRFTKCLCKAAALVLAFVGLATSLVLSVEAIRIPVLNFIIKQRESSSIVIFGNDKVVPPSEIALSSMINHIIPDNYEIYNETIDKNETINLTYLSDTNKIIIITITPSYGHLSIGAQDAEIEEVTINGHPGIYFEPNGYRVLWQDNNLQLIYDVYAEDLDNDTFWKLVYCLAD